MPPKVRINKADIIETAIKLVRENGREALNARAIAASLNCSTQPIFSNFSSMKELEESVLFAAYEIYLNKLRRECENEKYPKYKSFGMAYIRFAGEEKEIFLELKTIADAGLVGYPNAGKSTLLRAISSARPKVAAYPFTTLHPNVGVVEYPDFTRLTVADIPGLIDGAHANVGLGHAFLKHIERTHLLIFVLDMAGTDGRLPWDDLRHLREELELYMKGLSGRPAIILANKMDVPVSAENLELLKDELASDVTEIIPISADSGDLGDFMTILREKIDAIKARMAKMPK